METTEKTTKYKKRKGHYICQTLDQASRQKAKLATV